MHSFGIVVNDEIAFPALEADSNILGEWHMISFALEYLEGVQNQNKVKIFVDESESVPEALFDVDEEFFAGSPFYFGQKSHIEL